MYEYKAKLVRVIDGDTIVCDLFLGLRVKIEGEHLRFARIDAPEMKGETKEAGLLARDELNRFLADRDLVVHTIKKRDGGEKRGKYRYLAEVFILVGETEFCVNDWMVENKLAVYQDY